MKTKLFAALISACCCLPTAFAGNAVVTILDASQNPLASVKCIVSASNFPQPATNGVAVQWRNGGYTTDNTGSFTVLNAVPSNYHVQPVGLNFTAFDFTMPATNGTIYVQNDLWFTPPPNLSTNYPTFAQGDLRWAPVGGGGSGGGTTYTFANTNLAAGVLVTNGALVWVGTNTSGLASTNLLLTADQSGFYTNNGTLYNRGVLLGGTYLALSTNYTTAQFTNTALLVLGALPSYASSSFTTYTTNTGIPDLTDSATVVVSADGGTTWKTDPTNTPVIVAIQSITNTAYASSNVLIYSYLNNSTIGVTNDLTDRVVKVATAVDPASPVTLLQLQTSAASDANNWATFPATATPNLNGKGLAWNGTWKTRTSNNVFIASANLADILTITSGSSSNGVAPVLNSITVVGTNVTLQISVASVPTAQYNTNLTNTNGWTLLANQTNYQSLGYWYIQAPLPNTTNAFFRVYVSGTNTVLPVLNFSGIMVASNFVGSIDASNINSGTLPMGRLAVGSTNSTAGMVQGGYFTDGTNRWTSRDGQIWTNIPYANLTGVPAKTSYATNTYATNAGTAAALSGNIPESQVTSLVTDLAAKQATNAALTALSANNGGSLSNLDATKITGIIPNANLPALNYVASTNGFSEGQTNDNAILTGTTIASAIKSTGANLQIGEGNVLKWQFYANNFQPQSDNGGSVGVTGGRLKSIWTGTGTNHFDGYSVFGTNNVTVIDKDGNATIGVVIISNAVVNAQVNGKVSATFYGDWSNGSFSQSFSSYYGLCRFSGPIYFSNDDTRINRHSAEVIEGVTTSVGATFINGRTNALTTSDLSVGQFGTWNSNKTGVIYMSINVAGTITNKLLLP